MAKDPDDNSTKDLVAEVNKSKNYDYTAAKRVKKRDDKIREAGLSNLKVPMHKDDASLVRAYAKKLYEKRGFSLNTD